VAAFADFLANWRLPILTAGGTLVFVVSLWASAHAMLTKRDTRSAIGWVGFIWFFPIVGAFLYALLGINRIRRRARSLRPRDPDADDLADIRHLPAELVNGVLAADGQHLTQLLHLAAGVTHQPLVGGNRVTPLLDCARTYPAMLEAIQQATQSVTLATYIFDNDRAGRLFLEALRSAVARGVEVRVLIDDIGARYSWPSIVGPLQRAGVPVARFLPRWYPWSFPYANLRNHRKLLIVDGKVGFTGGMNIREGHCPDFHPRYPIQDLHFRIEGRVIAHMQEAFAEDWTFCTRESLQGERWFPPIPPAGSQFGRGIADGPDEDFENLKMILLGAVACAQRTVRIVTPYFLPDSPLITSLNVAAMRGVAVDIILPAHGNLRLVQWASAALLWQVLEHNCRVWLSPLPFDHTKLMVVDGLWSLIGSANWDPRSLQLNFEFCLEFYDRELASTLEGLFEEKRRHAQPLVQADVDGRRLPTKLRDGVARLLSPYL
jgi:cardiolipin synthase